MSGPKTMFYDGLFIDPFYLKDQFIKGELFKTKRKGKKKINSYQ